MLYTIAVAHLFNVIQDIFIFMLKTFWVLRLKSDPVWIGAEILLTAVTHDRSDVV